MTVQYIYLCSNKYQNVMCKYASWYYFTLNIHAPLENEPFPCFVKCQNVQKYNHPPT